MLSMETDYPPLVEIDGSGSTWTMEFSASGEHLVGGGEEGVRVWQVKDGKEVAAMAVKRVRCVAISRNNKYISAGTESGEVIAWNTKTAEFRKVFARKEDELPINAVDFSPDSRQLLVASSNRTAAVWDIASRKKVFSLPGESPLPSSRSYRSSFYLRDMQQGATPSRNKSGFTAARYSPRGDQIVTATQNSVQVYSSYDGDLMKDITVAVTPTRNKGLIWCNDQFFVLSDKKIKEMESYGSIVSQWPVPDTNASSSIALPQHGEFIVYATNQTVTFWDTTTHTQLGIIQCSDDVWSIAVSPDARYLALGGKDQKITINTVSLINDLIPSPRLHPTFQEPDIKINNTALESWKRDDLANANTSLTAAISARQNPTHHLLASRALVKARLLQWDAAMEDAIQSIKIQPSLIGYIAKSIVHVGRAEKHDAYRTCDIAFELFHSNHVSFLLLMKAIIVFMAGDHKDAISRLDDLIATVRFSSICCVVQAYMFLLVGKSRMESNDYDSAAQLFKHSQTKIRHHTGQRLWMIALISGWKFVNLDLTIRQHLCEALYVAGRTKEAGEIVLETTSLLKESAKKSLATGEWKDALNTAVEFMGSRFPRSMIYRAICERLEVIDRMLDASECLQQIANELGGETHDHDKHVEWLPAFKVRCCEKLECSGDVATEAQRHDEAITLYSAVISLNPDSPQCLFMKRSKAQMIMGLWGDAINDANEATRLDPSSPWSSEKVLVEWAKVELTDRSWRDALTTAGNFKVSRFTVYQVLCQHLETVDHVMDAIECSRALSSEMGREIQGEEAKWVLAFKLRCSEKLERLGDAAMDAQQHDDAIIKYSAVISLELDSPLGLLMKRSKAWTAKELWEDALNDLNEIITLNPLSPSAYETKHAILHRIGRFSDAVETFGVMLSKMAESPDANIRERRGQYISPLKARAVIRKTVQRIIRHSPRVLINTSTGRLMNKSEQAAAFESLPLFTELLSSMTTRIDRSRIKREVKQYFCYVMLSHKWEDNEPLFQQVIHTSVYDLDPSRTHGKLETFCKIVRDAGFNWAWSDTCCINKQDHIILQEALVAMFKWYRGSAMTIVFLLGVQTPAKLGDLVESIWNQRAWTFQEYVAAKVVRFYTEDWTLYLDLDVSNHKESPEIISEMGQATGVSVQQLTTLRPGLSNIREKLCLASTRETTLIEDAAYSLLGIFSVVGVPAIYGEGENSLARLLAHILTGSGNTSILAWAGKSSSCNSCLPARITVYSQPASLHIPPPIEDAEMEKTVAALRTSALDPDLAVRLYDHLNKLPAPFSAAVTRIKIPCIRFKLPPLSRSGRVYCVDTPTFGTVEIKTRQDLSRLANTMYLVHPWLDTILGRKKIEDNTFVEHGVAEPSSPGADDEDSSDEEVEDDFMPLPDPPSPAIVDTAPIDKETRALQLVARLRQPFGALLFSRREMEYRRVAADSTITVQIQESVSLEELLGNADVLDVL